MQGCAFLRHLCIVISPLAKLSPGILQIYSGPAVSFRITFLAVVLTLFSVDSVCAGLDDSPQPKNIIFFIADGAGPAYYTMTRDYQRYVNGREQLFIDSYLTGTVRTYSTDSRVTDSAASATSYASGIKTYNGAIGVDTLRRPMLTALEAAERAGLATGLVATSSITHATPASFSSHVSNRQMEPEIAAQQIDKEIEILLGGGRQFYLPASEGGVRTDGRDLLEEASEQGYAVANDLAAFRSIEQTPILSLFTSGQMSYEIDRDTLAEPSLPEMTAKALALLRNAPGGFFLVVEASRVDHAGHANDAASAVREMLAYDQAFKIAVEFAEEDGGTLVLATADHNTGGLSLGRTLPPDEMPQGAETYWRALFGRSDYEWDPGVLRAVSASAELIASRLNDQTGSSAETMREFAGIETLTDAESRAIESARSGEGNLLLTIGEIISRRAGIGWTTGGHTGVDVNLYAFGPESERFRGNLDNADIGKTLLEMLGSEVSIIAETPQP